MEVTLAIPNYNGGENLPKLIPQVLRENFNKVYVLDDASTDDSIAYLETVKDPKLEIVRGEENVGAGANRNRIIGQETGEVIMFLDADMELRSGDFVPKIIEKFEANSELGILGSLIISEKEEPMWYNYGLEMHPVRSAREWTFLETAFGFWENEEVMTFLREKLKPISPNLEISLEEPVETETEWVSEANFSIRKDLFAKLDGFDEKMRSHETHDLSKRARESGAKIVFSPIVKAKHLGIEVREQREEEERESEKYFYKKHYGMSDEVYDWLLPTTEESEKE